MVRLIPPWYEYGGLYADFDKTCLVPGSTSNEPKLHSLTIFLRFGLCGQSANAFPYRWRVPSERQRATTFVPVAAMLAVEECMQKDSSGQAAGGGTRRAIVDLGSNSVRLVVFEGELRNPVQVFNEKAVLRLATPRLSIPASVR